METDGEMLLRRIALALCANIVLPNAALTQVQPDEQTTDAVVAMSDLFLDQIVKEDFSAERKFLSPNLAQMASPEEWNTIRLEVIETAGRTQRYTVHAGTFYQDESLLVAVDFSGPAGRPGILICGFMVWELETETKIGLLRFEQNVVELENFRKIPVDIAAQMMVD